MFRYLLVAMRPKQWPKNTIIFLALAFSMNESWRLSQVQALVRATALTMLAFVLFCLVSSAVYLINDLVDIERDRQHPKKRFRPLASGKLSPRAALIAAIVLVWVAIPASFALSPGLGVAAMTYFVLNLAYSFILKHVVILDVLAIAGGFVLRAVAGALVIAVSISPWLYIVTTLGSLFLGFSKRRHEILVLDDARKHRKILDEYTPEFLDQMISIVASSTVMAYSLYTFSAPNLPKNNAMMLTIPFVLFGIFRYLYLIHLKNEGGSPEDVLLKDIPIIAVIALWLLTSLTILFVYRGG